jgi:hypothetical protein
MKKNSLLLGILCIILISVCVLSGCVKDQKASEPYTYTPCEEFVNISVTFGGGTAKTTRTFNFFTLHQNYDGLCYVQLDPAEKQEDSPSFNTEDNISYRAISALFPYPGLEKTIRSSHSAYVTDLLADTRYFYRVGCPSADKWSDWGSFTTDDGDGNFTFLHITDSQPDLQEEYSAFADTLRRALSDIPETEFILSTGDQVENGFLPIPGVWDGFYACIQAELMQTTFSPLLGNHEICDTFNANFPIPGFIDTYRYSYEYGNALFIFLDTNKTDLSSQFEWADGILSHSDAAWKILSLHKTPFSAGTHADDSEVLRLKEQIVPFAASRGIDLVLSGHDHIYARTYPLDREGGIAGAEQVNRDGKRVTYTNPYGVIYAENRCVGTKFYNKNSLNDAVLEVVDPAKVPYPVFSSVKIEGNKLVYTSYEYDNLDTKATNMLDCFEIIKT